MALDKGIRMAALAPHPPIVVPEIGGKDSAPARSTQEGLKELGRRVAAVDPGLLVMITPHGHIDREAVGVLYARSLRGDFSNFGRPDVAFEWPSDLEFAGRLLQAAKTRGRKLVRWQDWKAELDHGLMVPLYYLKRAGLTCPLVALTMSFAPYRELYEFGHMLADVCRDVQRVVLVASGDLSHRLTRGAPAGYDPKGKEFDAKVVDALSRADADALLNIDELLVERAGECGLRPIIMMLGAIAGVKVRPEVISYEGPFGVGYAVVTFQVIEDGAEGGSDTHRAGERIDTRDDGEGRPAPAIGQDAGHGHDEVGKALVSLARRALETYLRTGKIMAAPSDVPPALRVKAGAFVSLKKRGELRGCVGTIQPTKPSLAEEVIHNAIESGTNDPRFFPVTLDELGELELSVDVLSRPEPVVDTKELDPRVFGVIVEKGGRRGLLLPDLEGVDTVDEQLGIARRKAGIRPGEAGVKIYKFTVRRYKETTS